jgi:hypothetical protein
MSSLLLNSHYMNIRYYQDEEHEGCNDEFGEVSLERYRLSSPSELWLEEDRCRHVM